MKASLELIQGNVNDFSFIARFEVEKHLLEVDALVLCDLIETREVSMTPQGFLDRVFARSKMTFCGLRRAGFGAVRGASQDLAECHEMNLNWPLSAENLDSGIDPSRAVP